MFFLLKAFEGPAFQDIYGEQYNTVKQNSASTPESDSGGSCNTTANANNIEVSSDIVSKAATEMRNLLQNRDSCYKGEHTWMLPSIKVY